MARPSELLVTLVTVALVQSAAGHARTFTRCQLSRELLRYTFPRALIPKWVCLIEHTSGKTTDITTSYNETFASYGIFQISNDQWCKTGGRGGYCNIRCEDFLNQDLADDVKCAKRIYSKHKFKAWPSFDTYCTKNLPDLTDC